MPAIATVTTRPRARRVANVLPARSIWHSSQPPKMSPCGLVSAGIATARSAGSASGAVSTGSDGLADGSAMGHLADRTSEQVTPTASIWAPPAARQDAPGEVRYGV